MRAEDNVAKVYAQLDERLTKLIVAQPIFFVATASRQRFHDRGGSWRVVGVPGCCGKSETGALAVKAGAGSSLPLMMAARVPGVLSVMVAQMVTWCMSLP